MIPTSVRISIVIVAAALCVRSVMDGAALPAGLYGALAMIFIYNQFRFGRLAAGKRHMKNDQPVEARHCFTAALRGVEWRGRKTAIAAHTNLALLDLREGDYDALRQNLDAGYAYKPSRAARHWLDIAQAGMRLAEGDPDVAIALLVVVAAQMPTERTMTWVQTYLALALLQQDKIEEAVNTVGLAIKPARREKDRATARLVFSAAARVHDAAGKATIAEEMTGLAIENGMLEHGDAQAVALAKKYGFEAVSSDG